MEYHKFIDNSFRYGIFPEYTYNTDPIQDKYVKVNILVGKKNLKNLVKLVPKVVTLVLKFYDNGEIYDISPLTQLKKLKKLTIKSKSGNPRLLGVNDLSILKLTKLKIYGNILDSINPIMQWPQIKNKQFSHIDSITKMGNLTTYDLVYKKEYGKLLDSLGDSDCHYSENILLQEFNRVNFQLIYHFDDNIFYESITKKQFLSLIHNKKIEKDKTNYPKNKNDLYIEDKDENYDRQKVCYSDSD
jgi:hypothetical protein